jgi:hypothetical protein
MDMRGRVYGDWCSLTITDLSLLGWGKRRVDLKKIQNLLSNLFTRILHLIRISLALNKLKRRMNPKIEKLRSRSPIRKFRKEIFSPNSPIQNNVQRKREKVSLLFSKLNKSLSLIS